LNARDRKARERLTIGLLIDNIWDPIAWEVWAGVDDVATEQGANLLCFVGGALRPSATALVQGNVLYDLVSAENVDGLAIWGGGLGQFVSPEQVESFCERYRPLPISNAALPLENIPSVLVDNYRGMCEVVTHLVESHGYRRIAFIRGPQDHPEANERYRAYADVLSEHNIPLEPKLIAPGNFHPDSGRKAVNLLLDQRQLLPQTDFEAIVAVDDGAAISAIKTLQARGIKVPEEVAVTGFDNVKESGYISPPLTTVSSPVYEQARQMAKILLALLKGEEAPQQVILPTRAAVRRSCGCSPSKAPPTARETTTKIGKSIKAGRAARKEALLSAIGRATESAINSVEPGATEQLLDAFFADLKRHSTDESAPPAAFASTLAGSLHQALIQGKEVTPWQKALAALRQHALPHLEKDEVLPKAEELLQQAQTLIEETRQRSQAYRRFQLEERSRTLNAVNRALSTALDIPELMNIVAQELPQLGIEGAYISLYERRSELAEGDAEAPAERSWLILAYSKGEQIRLKTNGLRFPSQQLAPNGLLPKEGRYSMVIEPLHFQEEQLGLAMFEATPQEAVACDALQRQLSRTIKEALLFQQVADREEERERLLADLKRRTTQLQTAAEVSRAASSILDPDKLIRQVVELARERFDLYYAGLFLVDEAGQWALLRAGTGEAGREMLKREHKLEVGGASMIGWCIANKQARIALDVGEEAVRFKNPLLPKTRSELALPLVSRDKPIGALTIQSSQEAAFSEEDIAALQTMADQLANAIVNARLYNQAQREIGQRRRAEKKLEKRATQLAIINDIGGKIAAVLELGELFDRATQLVQESFGYDQVTLLIVDREGGEAVIKSQAGAPVGLFPPDQRIKLEQGMIGQAVRREETLLTNDVRSEPHYVNLSSGEVNTQSELVVPMRIGEEVVGILDVQSPQLDAFDENDVMVMETLSNQIAIAIQNARLYAAAQQELVERERAEAALARQARELDAELEQFARVAAHDLQEPLRMVAMYVQLLEQRYKGQLDTDADEFISYAVNGALRMRTLLNDLLTLSRVTTRGKPFAPTDCSVVLSQVLSNLRTAIEESDGVVTHDPLPTVMGDRAQITQVFQNLIVNAIQFHKESPLRIHVGAEKQDNEWVFRVQDNGIGIDAQYFERIFKVFQRLHVDPKHSGTGIGLAVCQKIVNRHGGRMWVESEPGQGSTFYFTIPEPQEKEIAT